MTNIAAYIEQVARHYWGEPTQVRGHLLRWGNKGSKEINKRKGVWFDYEENQGGGVIDLVRAYEGATLRALPDVLEAKFGIPKRQQQTLQPAKYISKIYSYCDGNG